MTDCSRRELLRRAALLAGVPVAGRLLAACAPFPKPTREVTLDYGATPGGTLSIDPTRYPDLTQPTGGAVIFNVPGAPEPILVVGTGRGDYFALGATCTHEGCLVAWEPERKTATCPCHLSMFASDGTVLNPPASAPLPKYVVSIDPVSGDLLLRLPCQGAFPEVQSGVVELSVAAFPQLDADGGSVCGHAPGLGVPLLLVRIDATTVHAFDATCPHQGCAVDHNRQGLRRIDCPCHGSTFDEDGKVLTAPAKSPLKRFDATLDVAAGKIKVRLE